LRNTCWRKGKCGKRCSQNHGKRGGGKLTPNAKEEREKSQTELGSARREKTTSEKKKERGGVFLVGG